MDGDHQDIPELFEDFAWLRMSMSSIAIASSIGTKPRLQKYNENRLRLVRVTISSSLQELFEALGLFDISVLEDEIFISLLQPSFTFNKVGNSVTALIFLSRNYSVTSLLRSNYENLWSF